MEGQEVSDKLLHFCEAAAIAFLLWFWGIIILSL